jgi:predicted RNase H-like nuclease (RuvC/YqgF family)
LLNGHKAQPQPQPRLQSQPSVSRPGPTESIFSRKGKADDLLLYFQLVQGMTATQQEKEFDQAKTDFSKGRRAEDRMRLALLSLLPGRSAAERGQTLKLAEEYLADNGREKTSLDGLALLLKQLLSEQRTLQRQLTAEKERGDGLARQLNEQKTQLDELKNQLDELKKIEKIISDRERKGLPEKRQ